MSCALDVPPDAAPALSVKAEQGSRHSVAGQWYGSNLVSDHCPCGRQRCSSACASWLAVAVRPPGSEDWEVAAAAWLLDWR